MRGRMSPPSSRNSPGAAIELVDLRDHEAAIIEGARALRRFDLSTAHRYPMRRDLKALPYEPVNLLHALTDDEAHVFDRTAVPRLYSALLARAAGVPRDFGALLVNGGVAARERFEALFSPDIVERLAGAGVLVPARGGITSRLRFVPCHGRLFVSDMETPQLPGMVWLGKDSMILVNALRRLLAGKRFRRGLEVGSGTGIQTMSLADLCETALGIDVNPRAVECGRINAAVNDVKNVEYVLSDLFEDVHERFDVIVSNPPYVFVPPEDRGVSLHAHGGEDYGVDFELSILAALEDRLNEGGMAVLLACSPVVRGLDVLPDRMRRRLSHRRLSFELFPLFNNVVEKYLDFHRSQGIEYTWAYILVARKGPPFALTVHPPSLRTRVMSWAFRSLVQAARSLSPS